MFRVIISHNQSKYISLFPKNSLFVFDDIKSEDIKECRGNKFITVESKGNRGYNRNAGLNYILKIFNPKDSDVIEFFDGDRFTIKYNEEYVKRIIHENDLGVLLYSCENDERHKRINFDLFKIVDTGTICNPFYSCGFAITVGAIKRIFEINGNELFDTSFNKWGCEDQYLGILCDKLGIKVAITKEIILNGNVGGDSGLHNNYRESLQHYVNKILALGMELRMIPKEKL